MIHSRSMMPSYGEAARRLSVVFKLTLQDQACGEPVASSTHGGQWSSLLGQATAVYIAHAEVYNDNQSRSRSDSLREATHIIVCFKAS